MGQQISFGTDTSEARKKARSIFQPSQPIRSQELLVGRARPLERTLDTLNTPGRSPFIYGVRGVGKTSLAMTAAYLYNWSGAHPIYVACSPQTTFGSIITRIVRSLLKLPFFLKSRKAIKELKLGTATTGLLSRIEESEEYVTAIDVTDAVELLNSLIPQSDQKSVVVVDEIDVATPQLKADLAYFIKQLGDQECKLGFIFAGIAENTTDLLTEHGSASRYIATIELQPLKLGELVTIVTSGFASLNLEIPDRLAKRIACLSDGFAHFTHLICLKLALAALDIGAKNLDADLFAEALSAAIEDSAAFLRDQYDKATQKYQDKYEAVLWAAADHWELQRSTEHMFSAYVRICAAAKIDPQDRSSFSNALYQLKQPKHASILRSDRLSWYQFSQAMMRGYCRIIAASKGVDVGMDYMKER